MAQLRDSNLSVSQNSLVNVCLHRSSYLPQRAVGWNRELRTGQKFIQFVSDSEATTQGKPIVTEPLPCQKNKLVPDGVGQHVAQCLAGQAGRPRTPTAG